MYHRHNLAVDACIIEEGTATDREMTQLMMKRNVLWRRIDNWREIQNVYMPSITKHLVLRFHSDRSLSDALIGIEGFCCREMS